MTISSELEAKILDQLGEFGEVRADVRTLKEDMADVKDVLAELVAQKNQSRGAKNAAIAAVGAVGGLLSAGVVDLVNFIMQLPGKH